MADTMTRTSFFRRLAAAVAAFAVVRPSRAEAKPPAPTDYPSLITVGNPRGEWVAVSNCFFDVRGGDSVHMHVTGSLDGYAIIAVPLDQLPAVAERAAAFAARPAPEGERMVGWQSGDAPSHAASEAYRLRSP